MYMVCKCPKHNKNLVHWKDTSTHSLFKCPECDYTGGDGVVHHDLPERYNKLEERIKELELSVCPLKGQLREARETALWVFEKRKIVAEKERLQERIKELEKKVLLSEAQNYCKMCSSTLDGYVPPGSGEKKVDKIPEELANE